ncbi:ATP-dependent DNA helicase [Microlunatus speluncae]|uniref:ATP-dependent DNA helicase n=1 Tax=Microlunatus speluncae TaxID=2594267 RepID=UPI0012663B0F|nr:ATP-dependent DNA helicase [Microlunatus speluncae]
MTVHTLRPAAPARRFEHTDDLTEALGIRFSDQQLAAITAPLEPGVIIAGAGSGKTTVMAARVVWLVGIGAVRPEEVLGLTFTRKAAAELSDRVRTALVRAGVVSDRGIDESGEQLIMTYDAFAARLVTEHGLRIGVDADPTMISGATRFRLASRVVRAAAGPFEFISRLRPGTVTDRVLRLDADLQQHLIDSTRLDKHAREVLTGLASAPLNNRGNVYADVKRAMIATEERLELASLVRDYQELKRNLGMVEFADQMAIAARLAAEVPQVSASLRAAFKVVLLDEYQDTSAAQAIMLRGLFSGRTPSDGLGHPVTAVGDPFQAIYGWRGAAASNILQFAGEFRTSKGQQSPRFALTVNRRSGHTILDVANVLSRPLRAETLPGAEESAQGMGLLQAPESAGPGAVRAATFESWTDEVRWIADQVIMVHSEQQVRTWAEIAILTRRNADIGPIYSELTGRDVPVEIVGLGGLLSLPEIADVIATLRMIDDVTANPQLIRLLTGPRWNLGPRDLALLGRRARVLAQQHDHGADEDRDDLLASLELAVADVDPTDVVSVLDALDSPFDEPGSWTGAEPRFGSDGNPGYSAAALTRFRQLSGELAYLRRHAEEPVLDLVRRVIAVLGLDVELTATPEFAKAARRDQLGAFLDAVADYVDVDGGASLSGLLAYLQAELDQGNGLDQAVPTDREAVKLLTVHKAKGLEWEVVFLPALVKGTFPSDRVTDNWVTNPAVLPADLRGDADSIPQLHDTTNAAMGSYKRELTEQQLLSEDRLAYVAATRAKQLLVGSGHWWRAELIKPRASSTYLQTIMAEAARQGELVAEAPPPGEANPLVVAAEPRPWPTPYDPDALRRRHSAATAVTEARQRFAAAGHYGGPGDPLLLDQEEVVAAWDDDIERLLAEQLAARSPDRSVRLPEALSASAVLRLNEDPGGFAADLARPMPRPPSRAARFGTRFHQWVEQHFAGTLGRGGTGQQPLIDPDDLPDRADSGAADDDELRELCAKFAEGQFGAVVPYALEAPFTLLLGGRLVRGRIDAVYRLADDQDGPRFRVLDWKTNRAGDADPLQLAIYRVAWAELSGVAVDRVDAAFYYVRNDQLKIISDLPERAELERLLLAP